MQLACRFLWEPRLSRRENFTVLLAHPLLFRHICWVKHSLGGLEFAGLLVRRRRWHCRIELQLVRKLFQRAGGVFLRVGPGNCKTPARVPGKNPDTEKADVWDSGRATRCPSLGGVAHCNGNTLIRQSRLKNISLLNLTFSRSARSPS